MQKKGKSLVFVKIKWYNTEKTLSNAKYKRNFKQV